MGPCFVDTNVLYYAVAGGTDPRAVTAKKLVRKLFDEQLFRTSTQVLQELFVNLMKKTRPALTSDAAIRSVDAFADWPVVSPGFNDIRDAMRLSDSAQISYWDALIVIPARLAGCATLYTEDLNHGQTIHGVLIINPFKTTIH